MNDGQAARDVLAERSRQRTVEGWTDAHDDWDHRHGELALAAAAYAEHSARFDELKVCPITWPWDSKSWKPKDRRRDLVRAAALIIAEIERLDRAATTPFFCLFHRKIHENGATSHHCRKHENDMRGSDDPQVKGATVIDPAEAERASISASLRAFAAGERTVPWGLGQTPYSAMLAIAEWIEQPFLNAQSTAKGEGE